MAGSHLGRSVVIVARPSPPIMVLVVVAHRSPRLWGDTIVTTTTIGRRVTITINHYHHHYHDHPISILIAVPPTQEGRTSTGWKFPLKSFWLRSHFGLRKLHATKVFCCWVTWQCRLVHA